MTFPATTYILRFWHTDGSEIEEVEHTTEPAAREHFALFGIEDADVYRRVELIEFDWHSRIERILAALELPA